MDNLVSGALRIEVAPETAEGLLRLDWKGRSNARQPMEVLGPFFEELAREARSVPAGVEMHFETLEHFNSATMTALIQLIQKLRQTNIKLAIVYNAGLKWQEVSFDALRVFVKPDGLLEIRGVT